MEREVFNHLVEEQIDRCRNTLIKKGEEYGGELETNDRFIQDCLHNFRVMAELGGVSLEQACSGFLGKHIVSIYDMCRNTSKGQVYSLDVWNEKLGDAINYLLILSAIVRKNATEYIFYADEKPHLKYKIQDTSTAPEYKPGEVTLNHSVNYPINKWPESTTTP